MSSLGKRLTALEEIAEEMRLRPIRQLAHDLAAEHGVSVERVLALYEKCHAESEALRARGLTPDEIIAQTAARMGVTPDELLAETEQMVKRYGFSLG